MTREERKIALYCLKASSDYHSEVCEECINYPNCDHTIQDDVTETIIKALEQEPCEDCVSRQAVIDAIDVKAWEFCDYLISKNRNDEQKPVSHFADNLRECVREELPSVNPQPKTGRWQKIEPYPMMEHEYRCSECYHETDDPFENFCSECGARMIGGDTE